MFCLGLPKSIKNTFQATTFKVGEHSRTFQEKMEFKDFSRTSPKIQGLFKSVRKGPVILPIKSRKFKIMLLDALWYIE